MTERKPPGMSFERWVDRQIREAQERGEFDDLPGKGKPIAGLDRPLDELWWVKQLMQREGLSITPPTLALRRDVEKALDSLHELPTEAVVREVVEGLNARIRKANRSPADGPPTVLAPFDVERMIERWRQSQG